MPIFQYECSKCGKSFEYLKLNWSSDKDLKCPSCGDVHPNKIICGTTFRMEGKRAMRSLPDPIPPLQELRGKGDPGFSDLPEYKPTLKKEDGIWKAKESSRKYY